MQIAVSLNGSSTSTHWRAFWKIADPRLSMASMCAILLGTAAASSQTRISVLWLTVTVLGIFCLEFAKNASGEIFDFDSGVDLAVRPEDRSPFSGGRRVLVEGWITRAGTARIAAVGYVLCVLAGIAIALFREPKVLWIGLAGCALAWFYAAPPVKLAYRGFGEIAVAIAYGPLICAGTYLVQTGEMPLRIWLLSIPMGLLTAAFLWANEFPDYHADKSSGKRNLVVQLGRVEASHVMGGIIGAAFIALGVLPFVGLPQTVLFGFAALPFAAGATQKIREHAECTAQLIPGQEMMLNTMIVFALTAGFGLVVGGL
jgi:1,4-dihydroxy-2-naphthoate octaprenyltransferase